MSHSDEYLPSANSMESCDTSHSSSRGEMEVPSMVQPYEGEPRASNEDFDKDLQRRFLARGVQVKLGQKSSRYWMFSLLRLCFGFYGEINVKNE